MNDPSAAYAVVIAAAELVSRDDREGALILLVGESSIPAVELQRAALAVFSFAMSGEHAADRYHEMRSNLMGLANDDGANVVLELEAVGAAEMLERGDLDGVNAIVSGTGFTPIAFAWCAACLCGQSVRGWLGDRHTPEIWRGLRRHFRVETTS